MTSVGQRRAVFIHQSKCKFNAKDPCHRIVNSRHRHFAFLDQLFKSLEKLFVLLRRHHHIHSGINRNHRRFFIVPCNLVDSVVIGDEKSFKTYFFFQDIRQQVFIGRAFQAIPTAVGRHNRSHTDINSRPIRIQMDPAQGCLINSCIPLVQLNPPSESRIIASCRTKKGTAVTDIVFRTGCNRQWIT